MGYLCPKRSCCQSHRYINWPVPARYLHLLRKRVLKALKGISKSAHTLELLGCSIEDFKKHLESLWKEGMSWENQGYKGWHIDHIRPCISFNLTDPEQQKQCFHWSNMQPLWAKENMEKGDKWDGSHLFCFVK